MSSRMGNDFFSAPHTDMSGSYPSVLHFDSDYTYRDRDNQSEGSAFPSQDELNTGPTAPRASYTLAQYAASRQPLNVLGLERLSMARVLASPALDGLLGYGALPAEFSDIPRSNSPESMFSPSDRSPPPSLVFSSSSGASSASSYSYQPSVAPTHTTYNLPGPIPAHSMPIIGEIPDLYGPTELIPSQCFFKDILETNCNQKLRTREEFHNHMLDHFDGPPPGKALCIFCNLDFENEDPWSCWEEYLDHIRYQHFRNGMVIEQMRPDFVTWAYLRDTGVLAQARYILICDLANERQPWKYPFLRPADWVSPRERERRLAAERQAEEENVVRITERSTRRNRQEQPRRQGQSNRQGQSSRHGSARGGSS